MLFENNYIQVGTFRNIDGIKMFSIQWKVDEGSDDSYHGFKIKKAKKVAKWLRKIAKRLEKL